MSSEIFDLAKSYIPHLSAIKEYETELCLLLCRINPKVKDKEIIDFFEKLKEKVASSWSLNFLWTNTRTIIIKACDDFLKEARPIYQTNQANQLEAIEQAKKHNGDNAFLKLPSDMFLYEIFNFLNQHHLAMLARSNRFLAELIKKNDAILKAPYSFPEQDCSKEWLQPPYYNKIRSYSNDFISYNRFLLAPNLHILITSSNKILVCRINDRTVVKSLILDKSYGNVSCLAFASDKTLISASYDKSCLHVWNINTGECTKILEIDSGQPTHIATLTKNKIVCGNENGKITIWNTETLAQEKEFSVTKDKLEHLRHLIVLQKNFLIASTATFNMCDNSVLMNSLHSIDIQSGTITKISNSSGREAAISCMLAFPNVPGQFIAGHSNGKISLYKLGENGKWDIIPITMIPLEGAITSLCFLNDSQIIVGSEDGVIKIYNIQNGKEEILESKNGYARGAIVFLGVTANRWIIGADMNRIYSFFSRKFIQDAENCNNISEIQPKNQLRNT